MDRRYVVFVKFSVTRSELRELGSENGHRLLQTQVAKQPGPPAGQSNNRVGLEVRDRMAVPKEFLDCAADLSPSLRVKLWPESDEKPQTIKVEHVLGARQTVEGRDYLKSLAKYSALRELLGFYKKHDGLQFCRTFDSRYDEVRPLLEIKPAESVYSFTCRYAPGGDLAWTMDFNKSKALYRGAARWVTFAEIVSGPACLTIFLDGEHAGRVFFATPQPWFNILRPIAKSFNALLDRIAVDPAAFLRLVRAAVTLRGTDGKNYGLIPIEYRPGGQQPISQPGRTNR